MTYRKVKSIDEVTFAVSDLTTIVMLPPARYSKAATCIDSSAAQGAASNAIFRHSV